MTKHVLTVRINKDTYDRAKAIAYHTPGLTLSAFVEQAMAKYQAAFDEYPIENIKLKRGPR